MKNHFGFGTANLEVTGARVGRSLPRFNLVDWFMLMIRLKRTFSWLCKIQLPLSNSLAEKSDATLSVYWSWRWWPRNHHQSTNLVRCTFWVQSSGVASDDLNPTARWSTAHSINAAHIEWSTFWLVQSFDANGGHLTTRRLTFRRLIYRYFSPLGSFWFSWFLPSNSMNELL